MIQVSLRRNVVIILIGVSYCYYRSESSDPTLTRPEQTEQTTQARENKPRVTRTGARRRGGEEVNTPLFTNGSAVKLIMVLVIREISALQNR